MKQVHLFKSHLAKLGGLEKQTLKIAEAFSDRGCEVKIISNGPAAPVALNSGVEVVDLGKTSKLSVWHIREFEQLSRKWMKENRAEIRFGIERNSGMTHYRAGNGVHAEYLRKRSSVEPFWKRLSFRWNPLHRTLLQIEKETYEGKELQKLFTNSEMVREEVLTHYSVDPARIEVLHNGVEWDAFQMPFELSLKEARHDRPYQFLFVGNGYARKGLGPLLEAASQLKEPFHLTVVGKEKNLRSFVQLANRLRIRDRVAFEGQQKDMVPYYQKADALVIPSLYDPFANVTVEALSMGLFVVSSPYNGGKEVLTEASGYVFEELWDRDALATGLKQAMKHPKTEKSARIIRESVRHLTFENQLKQLVSISLD